MSATSSADGHSPAAAGHWPPDQLDAHRGLAHDRLHGQVDHQPGFGRRARAAGTWRRRHGAATVARRTRRAPGRPAGCRPPSPPVIGRSRRELEQILRPAVAPPTRRGARPGARGVRAAVSARHPGESTPASARAAAASVEPVVSTSSTTTTGRPAATARDPARASRIGPWRGGRPATGRSAAGPPRRASSGRHGAPQRRATARASSSAWSKPRRRRRAAVVGAHVTTAPGRRGRQRGHGAGQPAQRGAVAPVLQARDHRLARAVVGEQRPAGVEPRRTLAQRARAEPRRAPAAGRAARRRQCPQPGHRTGSSVPSTMRPHGRDGCDSRRRPGEAGVHPTPG